jgi:hypothetical protein
MSQNELLKQILNHVSLSVLPAHKYENAIVVVSYNSSKVFGIVKSAIFWDVTPCSMQINKPTEQQGGIMQKLKSNTRVSGPAYV